MDGFIAFQSTTIVLFNREVNSLDGSRNKVPSRISKVVAKSTETGRAGWNAVTSSGEHVAANYGRRIPTSEERYGRAHEVVQLVQALWGSWGKDAWVHNKVSGQFAKKDQINPINLQGKYVGSRGPLYIPPSEQGQPIIFHAGGSPNAHELAGRFANAVIGAAFTIDDARTQRTEFRNAAKRFGVTRMRSNIFQV